MPDFRRSRPRRCSAPDCTPATNRCRSCCAWLAALWLPFAALLLAYAVLAKYARYDPAIPETPLPAATRLGFAGFLVPVFLPVTLCLTVSYAVRAERNLDRYLYDYD